MRFLAHITVKLPHDLSDRERSELARAESDRGLELMEAGKLVDIWRVPGKQANVSLYEVSDATELHDLLTSLPMWRWLEVDVQPLAAHPLTQRRDGPRPP